MINKIIKNKFSIFWIIIILIISFNYLSFNYFIKSFINLEKQENNKVLNSLMTFIDTKFKTIKITANDYSYWDDTYEFIKDQNEKYIYENFRDTTTTLENVNLDFMIFMNLENKNIHTQLSKNIKTLNKDNFTKYIVDSITDDENISIAKYQNNYYYIVKSRILKSDLSGKTRGFIYVGKKIYLENFNDEFKNSIKFIDIVSNKTNKTLKSIFLDKVEVHFVYSEDILSNIISLQNNNKNLAMLKLDNYRDIYKQGRKQIILFNTAVSIFVLILFFIFYFYIYYHKRLNIELEIRVEDEIKKQKAQEEILIHQSRSAEIGEMINNIAHQWRQPLNNLSLTIQNIGFKYENDVLTKEELNETIDKSKMIINSMSNTIDTFRNFFEPTKNKNLFKVEHSIENTLEILSSTLRFYNIEVVKEIIDDVEIYDYENEFSQVLLNIITNARDALVSNKIEKPIIKVNVSKIENNVIVKIKDNANGINEEIIDRIFEPYFTTKGKGNGTGIGLYMSKLIIEKNMNGKLTVKNDNDGAVFIITLNITKQEI
ncbi:CHASE4 sensor-containing signal transduction histidine kinase [Arcobacter acticola]|jgi:two-component system C4-dicarboxylate transport sensor histidine kinase DctB|uniref:histidine kinase n=1 Tax=Arcobacter acticola TaxID=1849015 RepID=A0A6M8EI46_9BACT|nr:ATP-binding protein [Arcobacter acticola]MBP6714609.1 GHKL domain-containing protein [Aliarcobacter sp.]QKE29006.1 CHASE4 sensor-containing signal transduction histidine kinase [Arcobacter acticola]